MKYKSVKFVHINKNVLINSYYMYKASNNHLLCIVNTLHPIAYTH